MMYYHIYCKRNLNVNQFDIHNILLHHTLPNNYHTYQSQYHYILYIIYNFYFGYYSFQHYHMLLYKHIHYFHFHHDLRKYNQPCNYICYYLKYNMNLHFFLNNYFLMFRYKSFLHHYGYHLR